MGCLYKYPNYTTLRIVYIFLNLPQYTRRRCSTRKEYSRSTNGPFFLSSLFLFMKNRFTAWHYVVYNLMNKMQLKESTQFADTCRFQRFSFFCFQTSLWQHVILTSFLKSKIFKSICEKHHLFLVENLFLVWIVKLTIYNKKKFCSVQVIVW